MNIYLAGLLALVVSYLLGSIPSAYLVCRAFKGVDIRKDGSGNVGAMNAIYTVGLGPGLLAGAADVGKGALSVYLATIFCSFARASSLELMVIQMLAGLAVIAGHDYPVYFKFRRGGRGGAAGIGVLFFMVPMGIPAFILLLLIMLGITRFLTISYALGFLAFPIVAWVQGVTPVDSWLQTSLPWLAWMRTRAADQVQTAMLVGYSIVIMAIPVLMYIPRIKEILAKSGGFKRAAFHRSVKERP